MAFGFGLSTFTDLIGLTDPITTAAPAPPRPKIIPSAPAPAQVQQQPRNPGQYEPNPTENWNYYDYNYNSDVQVANNGGVSSMYPHHPSTRAYSNTPNYTDLAPNAPVQVNLEVPPPPIPTTEAIHDLTRRSTSPTSSGVQIDLINLRQKLFRDIQNNMELVAEQQKSIQALNNRADTVETQYAHLKLDLEDLKRKSKEQEGKLKEIDTLVRSALTMTSFSCASSELHVEMVGDDGIAVTTAVATQKEE